MYKQRTLKLNKAKVLHVKLHPSILLSPNPLREPACPFRSGAVLYAFMNSELSEVYPEIHWITIHKDLILLLPSIVCVTLSNFLKL